MGKSGFVVSSVLAGLCSTAFAGPITTVPWNGHDGAVSFTFDDGSTNQLDQLGSYFDANPDVKVTFFITGAMYAGAGDLSGYINMTKKGHEIGNHSKSHSNLTQGANLQNEISGYKSTLQGKGIEVVSFATPYCASNATVETEMNKGHIANRNCAGAKYYAWGSEPQWMNLSSNCYTNGGANTNNAKSYMGQAKSQKAWTVQLNHGVGTSDQYGISTNDMKSIMDEAKKQGLWIAPFGYVAAYYRAHFVIDKATSTNTGNGFKVTWTSPHSAMPKSVPLRVKIEGASGKTVTQKGKSIQPESDGTYVIEFMDLELEVGGGAAASTETSTPVVPESSSSVIPESGSSAEATVLVNIPGKVEAENFDATASMDSDGVNEGDAGVSTDGVDVVLVNENDVNAGKAVGYTAVGEYLGYSVNASVAGDYSIEARVASGASTGAFTVSIDDKVVATFNVPNTGDWQTYQTV
ncbi:MAG: carbohydrate-binding protein, partial [Fibrobacteraceae bacterium]|nr:carbohydrate-binding protein [Fibrobacteraceae bacterium]